MRAVGDESGRENDTRPNSGPCDHTSTGLRVTEIDDPAAASAQAHEFLVAFPAQHNVLLTVLEQSGEAALGGRFWIVADDGTVRGFALQSPSGQRVGLARMHADAIRALADAIDAPVPGVVGAAADAATFAGHFAERHNVGRPVRSATSV
jgi:hypothetical protein